MSQLGKILSLTLLLLARPVRAADTSDFQVGQVYFQSCVYILAQHGGAGFNPNLVKSRGVIAEWKASDPTRQEWDRIGLIERYLNFYVDESSPRVKQLAPHYLSPRLEHINLSDWTKLFELHYSLVSFLVRYDEQFLVSGGNRETAQTVYAFISACRPEEAITPLEDSRLKTLAARKAVPVALSRFLLSYPGAQEQRGLFTPREWGEYVKLMERVAR